MTDKTIQIKKYKDFQAIHMIWDRTINRQEIQPVFNELRLHLDAENTPIYVVVDLRDNIIIPMIETFRATMSGVHQHENLKGWW